MKQLCPNGRWRFPVCFITNGGGVPEAHKAQQLSKWLGVPVGEQQVVLSHTPMRPLAAALGQQPVLVVGRHEVAAVAASYGFSKVLTTRQLAAALGPGALPFLKHSAAAAGRQPDPGAGGVSPVRDLGWGSEQQPIAAVLVCSDPAGSDWYQDLQLLTDVITSHGVPSRTQPVPGSQPVQLFFSNPDLVWATDYPRPRFGQGAFSTMLAAVHSRLTGTPLPNAKWFGKPNPEPYRIAEQLLLQQAVQLGLADAAAGTAPGTIFSSIFAVGDNPAADVRGANQAGAPWVSVLVRSGVFTGAGNDCQDPAHLVVDDVAAAVAAALHRARSSRWHSMR
ncbi:hypothetical protein OEZ86_011287 [Tetradesmus obliquus]|nr:hypothetical protein OEZ86_011287 [Tetradesmus obliquus]